MLNVPLPPADQLTQKSGPAITRRSGTSRYNHRRNLQGTPKEQPFHQEQPVKLLCRGKETRSIIMRLYLCVYSVHFTLYFYINNRYTIIQVHCIVHCILYLYINI